jgi:uncharacterized protein
MHDQSEPISMWFDRRLVLRQSPIHGIGTFATEAIPAGQLLILVSGGLVFTAADWQAGRVQVDATMYNQESLGDDVYLITPKAFHYYVNHGCAPNAVDLSRRPNTTYYIAWHDIPAGTEITTDYGIYGSATIAQCGCQSAHCRSQITPDDWRQPELQQRYRGAFPWWIERQLPPVQPGA